MFLPKLKERALTLLKLKIKMNLTSIKAQSCFQSVKISSESKLMDLL